MMSPHPDARRRNGDSAITPVSMMTAIGVWAARLTFSPSFWIEARDDTTPSWLAAVGTLTNGTPALKDAHFATSIERPPPPLSAKSMVPLRILSSPSRTSFIVASGIKNSEQRIFRAASSFSTVMPAIFIVVSSATIKARFPSFSDWQTSPTVCRASWPTDRKSTRLNSSHQIISYAVFCSARILPHYPSFPTRRSSDLNLFHRRIRDQEFRAADLPGREFFLDGHAGDLHRRLVRDDQGAFPQFQRLADLSDRVQGVMADRSEEHTSELQSPDHLVCRLLLCPYPPALPLFPYTTLFRSEPLSSSHPGSRIPSSGSSGPRVLSRRSCRRSSSSSRPRRSRRVSPVSATGRPLRPCAGRHGRQIGRAHV